MNKRTSRFSLALVVFVLACGENSGPPNRDIEQSVTQQGATMSAVKLVEMTWAPPQGFSVAEAAFNVSRIMLPDVSFDSAPFLESGERFVSSGSRFVGDETWNAAPLEAYPDLHVKYHARFNDLRISNRRLQRNAETPDVGPNVAREKFLATFAELVDAGVIDAATHDPQQAKVSFKRFFAGRSDIAQNDVVPIILEYRYTILRRIEGIRIANAGLRIAVHRSGEVSAIRVGGSR